MDGPHWVVLTKTTTSHDEGTVCYNDKRIIYERKFSFTGLFWTRLEEYDYCAMAIPHVPPPCLDVYQQPHIERLMASLFFFSAQLALFVIAWLRLNAATVTAPV